jgi:hypothetical protein
MPRMMPAYRVVALVIALTAASCVGAAEAIRALERRAIGAGQIHAHLAPPHAATHALGLTLVYFDGGVWREDEIQAVAYPAAGLLAQCGVTLVQVEVVRVEAPPRYRNFFTPLSRELARVLQLPKPAVFFVTDTRQQPAFDAEAIGRGNSRTRPELADTVWITRATRDPAIALAHELAHVLMDSGEHVIEPGNLMREDTTPDNTRLNAAQCAQLRATGTANGLLQPLEN